MLSVCHNPKRKRAKRRCIVTVSEIFKLKGAQRELRWEDGTIKKVSRGTESQGRKC